MKKIIVGTVKEKEQLTQNIFKLTIHAPKIAQAAIAGQFVNIYPKDKSTLLPRPISICNTNGTDTVNLVIAVVGKGTAEFSSYDTTDKIYISTPLGNGFDIEKASTAKNVAVVGGGVGVPPMLVLAKELSKKANVTAFLGYRTDTFLVDEFKAFCKEVHIATDDGSVGLKGNVVQLIKENPLFEYYFSCGPKPMLKALSEYLTYKNVPVQVSLEERMGCGYGACVGCVCKITSENKEQAVQKKVCTDGPVFFGSEVVWN